MDFTHVSTGKDDEGRRLDKIIRRYLNDQSLSGLYSALRKGLIKVDGKKCPQDFRVGAGSDIAIASLLLAGKNESRQAKSGPDKEKFSEGKKIPADLVLFRNEDLLILNKPYDIPVQKAETGDCSLADMVTADYKAGHKKSRSLSFRPGPLHRLDRKTTGIIVFSQSLRGAQWFSQAIQNHSVRKIYLALLEGKLKERQEWKDIVIKKDTSLQNFKTVSLSKDGEDGKNACSKARALAYGHYQEKPVTLAEIEITTGRKHQIRAQASAHGFPLLGDTAYGGMKISQGQDFFLHAHRLIIGENPLGLPPEILADISTNFEKMSEKCLINFNSRL